MDPAAGYSPEYLREYRGDQLINVSIAFIVLVSVAVALRFIAKAKTNAPLALDDYLIIPALISDIANSVLALLAAAVGHVGFHTVAVEQRGPKALEPWFKCLFGIQWAYAFATAFPKISVLCFYLRIFPMRKFRYAVYVLMFLIVGLSIGIIFASLFQCSPIPYAWDKTIKGGTCINELAYYRWMTPPNLLIDIGILVLPLPVVWRLQTSLAQRAGLTVTFVMGSMGVISACVRMSVFFVNDAFEDFTWTAVELMTWTVIEPAFYVIAACFPSYRPLFVKAFTSSQNRTPADRESKDNSEPSSRGRTSKFLPQDDKMSARSHTTISGGKSHSDEDDRWKDPNADWIPLNSIQVSRDVRVEV